MMTFLFYIVLFVILYTLAELLIRNKHIDEFLRYITESEE